VQHHLSSELISVVVSTYEWPEALDVVLASLADQDEPRVEVVVADDGSGPGTEAVVGRWRQAFPSGLLHAWQPNDGYRRARVLNEGARIASGSRLLFLDGDCLARRGLLRAVRRAALPGWFLSSKRLSLGERLSRRVLEEHVPVWRWSALRWFLRAPRELISAPREAARPGLLLPIRDRRRPWRPRQAEFFPPYEAYGFFFAVARADFERVNGFDMRYEGWGGEDKDLAARLRRSGLRCGWAGPATTMLHLWHPTRKGMSSENAELLRSAQDGRHTEAVQGARELASEHAGAVRT
jgi:GT2 family glycosyltransferase